MTASTNPLLGAKAPPHVLPSIRELHQKAPRTCCFSLALVFSTTLFVAGALLFQSVQQSKTTSAFALRKGPSPIDPPRTVQLQAEAAAAASQAQTLQFAATAPATATATAKVPTVHLNLTSLFDDDGSGASRSSPGPKFGVTEYLCGFGEGKFETLESGVLQMIHFIQGSEVTASDGSSTKNDVLEFLSSLNDSKTVARIFRSASSIFDKVPKTGDGIMTLLMLLHAVARDGRPVKTDSSTDAAKSMVFAHSARTLQLGGPIQVVTLEDGSLHDASAISSSDPPNTSSSLWMEMDCQRQCTASSAVLTYSCQAFFAEANATTSELEGSSEARGPRVKTMLDSTQAAQTDAAATIGKLRAEQNATDSRAEASSEQENSTLKMLEKASTLQAEVDKLLSAASHEHQQLEDCESKLSQQRAEQADCRAWHDALEEALSQVKADCQNDEAAASTQLTELATLPVDSSAQFLETANSTAALRPTNIQWNISRQLHSKPGCESLKYISLKIGVHSMVKFIEGAELTTSDSKVDKDLFVNFLKSLESLDTVDQIFRPERKIFQRLPATSEEDIMTLLVLLFSVAKEGQRFATIPLNKSTDVAVTLHVAKTLQLWDALQVATLPDGKLYDASALSMQLPSPSLHLEVDCHKTCGDGKLTFQCQTLFPQPKQQADSPATSDMEIQAQKAKLMLSSAQGMQHEARAALKTANAEAEAGEDRSAAASRGFQLAKSMSERASSSKEHADFLLSTLERQRRQCNSALQDLEQESSSCSKTLPDDFVPSVRTACSSKKGKSSNSSRGRTFSECTWFLLFVPMWLLLFAR